MQYEIRMKLKIGSRRGREGESWDSKELICFPPSFLLLCLSAFLLRGLVCFFTALLPLSYLKCHIMGQHSAVIGGDKKPGRSHSDQQPQQHTVWGTTLACAAENSLYMFLCLYMFLGIQFKHLCFLLHLVSIQPILLPPGDPHPLTMLIIT